MTIDDSKNGEESSSTEKRSHSRTAMLIKELHEERLGQKHKHEESETTHAKEDIPPPIEKVFAEVESKPLSGEAPPYVKGIPTSHPNQSRNASEEASKKEDQLQEGEKHIMVRIESKTHGDEERTGQAGELSVPVTETSKPEALDEGQVLDEAPNDNEETNEPLLLEMNAANAEISGVSYTSPKAEGEDSGEGQSLPAQEPKASPESPTLELHRNQESPVEEAIGQPSVTSTLSELQETPPAGEISLAPNQTKEPGLDEPDKDMEPEPSVATELQEGKETHSMGTKKDSSSEESLPGKDAVALSQSRTNPVEEHQHSVNSEKISEPKTESPLLLSVEESPVEQPVEEDREKVLSAVASSNEEEPKTSPVVEGSEPELLLTDEESDRQETALENPLPRTTLEPPGQFLQVEAGDLLTDSEKAEEQSSATEGSEPEPLLTDEEPGRRKASAETHLPTLETPGNLPQVEARELPSDSEEADEQSSAAEPPGGFGWFIDKYYGGNVPQGLQMDKDDVAYMFAKASYDVFELMQKAVSENDPEEPLIVDTNLLQQPQPPTSLPTHSSNITYGGNESIFAEYDSLAKKAKEAALLTNRPSSTTHTETKASDENAEGQATSPVALHEQEAPISVPSPEKVESQPGAEEKKEEVLAAQAQEQQPVATTSAPVSQPANTVKEPEFTIGTETVEVNGVPVTATTYTDRTGKWTRADEIIAASGYSGRKDVRKATGVLAGFKNIRRIRPPSEGGTEAKPEVFVSEAGLRKMLTKLERQAAKLASKVKTVAEIASPQPTQVSQPPAAKLESGTKETPVVELDSAGTPVLRVSSPVGPNGGMSTIRVNGKDLELPSIENGGIVWYYIGSLLDELGYTKRDDRSKLIRKFAGNQNVRLLKRQLYGGNPNNYLHVNKEGIKLLVDSILGRKSETPAVAAKSQISSVPAETQPVGNVNKISEVTPLEPKPITPPAAPPVTGYRESLRIIIDEQPLFVKGYTDQTTWYSTPDMLEFVGIVDPMEQRAFLSRVVDPKEIREIYQDDEEGRVLEPHVSIKGLGQLIPALNKVVSDSRRPMSQPSHVAFTSVAPERKTAWMPNRPVSGGSLHQEGEALSFGKERMNVNHKDVTIRTIRKGVHTWYEANSILQAAGVDNGADQTDLLNRIVYPENQYRPIKGASARTFVNRAGLLAIFEALGTILGPSRIEVPDANNDVEGTMEQEKRPTSSSPMRLGETEIDILGRKVNVKTAFQDNKLWFYCNDIMAAFNKFQQEEGGHTIGLYRYTKFVNYYVSSNNLRALQQKLTGKAGTRLSLHVNLDGLKELEKALRAVKEGVKPEKVAITQKPPYPSAQEEVDAIAARLHGQVPHRPVVFQEVNTEEENEPSTPINEPGFAGPETVPSIGMPHPAEVARPLVSPNPMQAQMPQQPLSQPQMPMQPQMPAQPSIQQGFNSPQPFVQPQPMGQQPLQPGFIQPQQQFNPLTGQPMPAAPQMPLNQMPQTTQWPGMPQVAGSQQGVQWPNQFGPQQPMPALQPVTALQSPMRNEIAPKQILVRDSSLGPNSSLIPADVLPVLGRELVVRKRMEADGPWYYYLDLFNALGIAEGSPLMNMFTHAVHNGAFKSYWEATPFGYRQANYVNGIGLIEIINELEKMTQSAPRPQQPLPMPTPAMPQYQQPAPMASQPMSPFGVGQPGTVFQQPQPANPFQPQTELHQAKPVEITKPVPPASMNNPMASSVQPAKVATPTPVEEKEEKKSFKIREAPKKDKPYNIGVKRDAAWLKNEERNDGVFVMEFNGKKIRFIKDKDRKVYVNMIDIMTIVGRSKFHLDASYFEPNGFVKFWTPTLNGDRVLVYLDEHNLKGVVDRSKKSQAKRFFKWFVDNASPTVLANAPVQEGL